MGEGEGEEQQRQCGDDAQETHDVSRCPEEDRYGATRSMGEGESRKENRLTKKRKAGRFHMPRLNTSLGIFISRVISLQFVMSMSVIACLQQLGLRNCETSINVPFPMIGVAGSRERGCVGVSRRDTSWIDANKRIRSFQFMRQHRSVLSDMSCFRETTVHLILKSTI